MLKRNVIIGALWAGGVSSLISFTTTTPLWLSLPVMLFNWPITEIIIEHIASRNPDADKRITVHSWWPPFITLLVIMIATTTLHFVANLPFWKAFAYSTLILTTCGAIFGITSELEDNMPGGWLNPNGNKNKNG